MLTSRIEQDSPVPPSDPVGVAAQGEGAGRERITPQERAALIAEARAYPFYCNHPRGRACSVEKCEADLVTRLADALEVPPLRSAVVLLECGPRTGHVYSAVAVFSDKEAAERCLDELDLQGRTFVTRKFTLDEFTPTEDGR